MYLDIIEEGLSFDLRIHHAGCSMFCFAHDPLYRVPDAPYSAAIRVAEERIANHAYCTRPVFQVHFMAAAYVQIAVDHSYFDGMAEEDVVTIVRDHLLKVEHRWSVGLHQLIEELTWRVSSGPTLYSRPPGGKGFSILGLTAIPPSHT